MYPWLDKRVADRDIRTMRPFHLRLLIASCAAPLTAATFVGVAYLTVHVHLLFAGLNLGCLALTFMVGAHIVDHGKKPRGILASNIGVIVVVSTIAGAYISFFDSVAERHMCTVVEAHSQKRPGGPGGGGGTSTSRRLVCDDGHTETLGSLLATEGTDTTDEHKGERVLVAYDPSGRLPSLDATTVDTTIGLVWLAGIGWGLTVVVHIGVIITDQSRREAASRAESSLGAQ